MCASRGQAGDQNVALALGVKQMPDVPGMHDIERAMAHDDLLLARRRADRRRRSPAPFLILWLTIFLLASSIMLEACGACHRS